MTEDYNTKDVIERVGIHPNQVTDLKGLMGDSSDNIPGVPGIGEKTALKILAQFPTLEEAIERIEEMPKNRAKELLKNNIESARLSKELATIKTDCELPVMFDKALIKDLFNAAAYDMIKKLEFKSILNRFDSGMGTDKSAEDCFHKVTGKTEADKIFKKCEQEARIGIKIVLRSKENTKIKEDGQFMLFDTEESKDRLLYAAVAFGTEPSVYLMKPDKGLTGNQIKKYFTGYIQTKGHKLITEDLKGLIEYFGIENPAQCFDAGLAAYTIDPTKGS